MLVEQYANGAETAISTPTSYGLVAEAMLANGWPVLPLRADKKEPFLKGWPERNGWGWEKLPAAAALIAREAQDFYASACGIASSAAILAVDIDVTDPEAAAATLAAFEHVLGQTPLLRVGRPPKVLGIWRRADPEAGKWSPKPRPVEIFSGSGQFAAFGWHEGAGKPYTWERDDSPLTMRAHDPAIPLVTIAQVQGVLTRINGLLGSLRAAQAAEAAERLGLPRKAASSRLWTASSDGARWAAARNAAMLAGEGQAVALAAFLASITHGGATGPIAGGGNAHNSLVQAAGVASRMGWSRDAFADFAVRWAPPSVGQAGVQRVLAAVKWFEPEAARRGGDDGGAFDALARSTSGFPTDVGACGLLGSVDGTTPESATAGAVEKLLTGWRA